MTKKSFVTLLLMVVGALFLHAEESSTSAQILDAIFSFKGDSEDMRKVATIQTKLKAYGFQASAPVASKVEVWSDNDTHFKVKSTRITYTKNGEKVIVNIPNAAKYKSYTEVSLSFPTIAARNAFYQEVAKHGFSRDDDAVEGVQYMGVSYILSSDSDRDLNVCIGFY